MTDRDRPIDFREFHEVVLPQRLAAGRGALAAADDLERIGALAFRTPEGVAFTYLPREGDVDVVAGESAADTVIELEPALWSQLAQDLESAPGLLYANRCRVRKGDAMRFVRWEPGLRALYHGRPVFRPEQVELRDRRGAPLDVSRGFTLEDDREEMAHFLGTAGYLWVRGVFSAEEVAGFLQCADVREAAARQGDKRSWWGRDAEGRSVLCRVTHCEDAEALRGLPTDPRVTGLAALSEHDLVPRTSQDEDGIAILRKNPDMAEGLSDLPWHRDCGMGGHASMCPRLIVSIFLAPSRPETGELLMLPGSHEASLGFFEATDPRAPRGVSLAADPGDVTLHYGDIMHAAPPPTGVEGPFRRCVLLCFARADAFNHRGDSSYNDVLLGREDGQVEHLAKIAKRSNA